MITLTISNDNKECGGDCPFLDIWTDTCLLFKEGLVTKKEWGEVVGWKACRACNMVVDRASDYE